MGIVFHKEPQLENVDLIAAWPGIGNVGLIAVDTLRGILQAEQFAEIEPWDFFYPHKVSIADGELKNLEFPSSRFYFKKMDTKDLIFFIGDEQPGGARRGYQIANLVLDVGLRFGCRKVYTAAAAVAPIHHTLRPKVWVVPNRRELIDEVKRYSNTILMGELEGRSGQGNITGLNGLLLGVARRRGLDGVCLLGEIPVYVAQLPTLYPKASRAILEVLTANLGLTIDLGKLDALTQEVDNSIENLYQKFPPEIRRMIDQLKQVSYPEEETPGLITDEDKKRMLQEIDEFFKKGDKEQ
jgi:hypothetical protein